MVADRSHGSDSIYMTVAQYLALDEATDAKYEYDNGYVYMLRPPSSVYDEHTILDLAGGSNAHAALCLRIGSLLDQALPDGPCIAFTSDARMQIAERQYYYPDITVACGEGPGTKLTNPIVVIEVLSPATEKRDRGAKFKVYKTLPTVQEYVLVGSEYQVVEVYRREGSFWRQNRYQSGDQIELRSISVSFSFDALYRRIPM